MWVEIRRVAEWLNEADRNNPDITERESVLLRLLKVNEELGELVAAYIGMVGQNPRKGVTHTKEDVVNELCDVIVSSMVALATLQPESCQADLHNRVLYTFHRADLRY